MLFVYNETQQKLKLKATDTGDGVTMNLMVAKQTVPLAVCNMPDVPEIGSALMERYGKGFPIKGITSRQYVIIRGKRLSYDSETNKYLCCPRDGLTRSEMDIIKQTPRNMVVMVVGTHTRIYTNPKNLSGRMQFIKVNDDIKVCIMFPKWSAWSMLKFPIAILTQSEGMNKKLKLSYTESKNKSKDGTPYIMNNLDIGDWEEGDFIPERKTPSTYKDGNKSRRAKSATNGGYTHKYNK